MKSRFELLFYPSNNWLRLHGYAMRRCKGNRKRASIREMIDFPFPETFWLRKSRRVKHIK